MFDNEKTLQEKFHKWSLIELKLTISDIEKLGVLASREQIEWLDQAKQEVKRRETEKTKEKTT